MDLSCQIDTNLECEFYHAFGSGGRRERDLLDEIGGCPHQICSKAVDDPRQQAETDTAFYKRMDEKYLELLIKDDSFYSQGNY